MVNQLVGFGVYASAVAPPITDYTNAGGQGDRTASITASQSGFTLSSGTINNLVDGGTGLNGTDSIDIGTGSYAAGSYFRFDFGVLKYIDEIEISTATISGGTATAMGTWDARVTNDLAGYVVGNAGFTWANGSTPVLTTKTLTGLAPSGYRYLEIYSASGGTGPGQWIQEIRFKIAAGV